MFAVLVGLVILIPLVISPFSLPLGYEDAFEIKRTILEAGALLLLVLGAGQAKSIARSFTARPYLALPLVYLGYLALHSLFVGPGRIAACKFYEIFCLVVIFYGAVAMGRDERRLRKLIGWICLAGLLIALGALGQHFQGGEPFSTIGNRNYVATILMVVIPSGLFFLLEKPLTAGWKKPSAIYYAVVVASAAGGLWVCQSKAAIVALAVTGLVLLFLRRRRKTAGIFIFILAIFVLLVPLDALVKELVQDVRPALWECAGKMGLSHPLGTGLGQFFVHVPGFRTPDYFLMTKSADTTFHAHNDYLEIFAETGWIGLVLFLSFLILLLRDLAIAVSRKDAPVLTMTLFACLGALAVKIFFDMDMAVVSSAFFFWLIAGLAIGRMGGTQMPQSKSTTILLSVVAAVLGVFLFVEFSLPFARAQWQMKLASRAQNRGDWAGAQQYYANAMREEPALVEIPFRLGYAYARTGQWEKALDAYRMVRATAPFYSNVVFNMAAVCRQKGDVDGAWRYLREGFAINPYSLEGHDIARELFLLSGDIQKAQKEEALMRFVRKVKAG